MYPRHPGTQFRKQDARRMHVFVTVQLLTEYQLSVHNVLVNQYQHLGLFLFHFYPYPYCYCYSLHLHLRSSNAALVIIKHFLFTALFFTAKELIPIIRNTPTRRHSNAVFNTRHGLVLVLNIPFISPSI